MSFSIKKINYLSEEYSDFLNDNPHTFYCKPEYLKFIEDVFKIKVKIICATDTTKDNKIITSIPIVETGGLIFPRRVISVPYIEYGGFVGAKEGILPILCYIKENFPSSKNIEIRTSDHLSQKQFDLKLKKNDFDFQLKIIRDISYVSPILKLTSEEELWQHIHKHKRNEVRKAINEGITCKELNPKDVDSFYQLYLNKMRAFSTPPYNKEYFLNFFNTFINNGQGICVGAFYKKKLVSANLGFIHNKKIHITCNISDDNYKDKKVNTAVYWETIKWACNIGLQEFDFGRSHKDATNITFKKKWNLEIRELPYLYVPIKNEKIEILNQYNNKFSLHKKIWQHLPLKATEILGMFIRKQMGI